jgi:hypothetical protein
MRDETADIRRRDAMAMAAAPYIHPRLASVEHGGNQAKPLHMVMRVEFVRAINELWADLNRFCIEPVAERDPTAYQGQNITTMRFGPLRSGRSAIARALNCSWVSCCPRSHAHGP